MSSIAFMQTKTKGSTPAKPARECREALDCGDLTPLSAPWREARSDAKLTSTCEARGTETAGRSSIRGEAKAVSSYRTPKARATSVTAFADAGSFHF
jgi:hypothetical protein